MSESVTPGPLGNIPATTSVYTAAQTDALVATLNAALSGITECGWSALSDIVSGVETFVTKSGLADIISVQSGGDAEINSVSGMEGGYDCSGVCYYNGGEKIRLLDRTMFGFEDESGLVSGVRLAAELSRYYDSENVMTSLYAGLDANIVLGGGSLLDSGRRSSVMSAIDSLVCGYDDGSGIGDNIVPVFVPYGTTLCDAIESCISSSGSKAVTTDNICDLVSGCISGMGINWVAINNAISGLNDAVGSLTDRISGMVDDLSLAIADALTAADSIVEHEELPDEIKQKVQRARRNAADEDVVIPMTDDVKRKTATNIQQDIAPAVDDVKRALDDGQDVDANDPDLPADTHIDMDDAATANTDGGETAQTSEAAAETAAAQVTSLQEYAENLIP